MHLCVFAGALTLAAGSKYIVDHDRSALTDTDGRQRYWHGVNFVEKNHPYYPTINEEQVALIKSMGLNSVRLGVMVSGLFEAGPKANTTYLDVIEGIVDFLHGRGLDTIIDLHQDVLAPKLCGEGTPDWMLNLSSLHAWPLPRPLRWKTLDVDPETGHPLDCSTVGPAPLQAIGWSEWKLTDACGKAYQRLYDNQGSMAEAFAEYWQLVAARFKGHPGVLAYELMNEPWVGDHVSTPSLLLKAGAAEEQIGKYMQRMHDIVRTADPNTLVMYAASELSDLTMRRVGYERGFLPEAALAYHVYCIVGTDGDGPTTFPLKELCHLNDMGQMSQRAADLRRLRTAGFVTEFGAVNPSETGLAEVRFVLERFEAADPPASWAFWDFSEIVGHSNKTQVQAYISLLSRPFPSAVAGELWSLKFDSDTSAFEMKYKTAPSGRTELVLPAVRYAQGYDVQVFPHGIVTVDAKPDGLLLTANSSQAVTVKVSAKAGSMSLV